MQAATERAKATKRAPHQRERILDALYAVMAEGGSASVSDIAEAAGIARGSLHYYFESKDEIVCALMRRLGAGYLSRMTVFLDKAERRAADADADANANGSGFDVVGDLVRWHFAGDTDEATRLLGVWLDFWGQAPARADIGAVVYEVQEQARACCRRALLLRRPELAVLDDVVLRLHGAALLAIIEGGLLQWRVAARDVDGGAFDRAVLGGALAAAASAFCASISVPASAARENR